MQRNTLAGLIVTSLVSFISCAHKSPSPSPTVRADEVNWEKLWVQNGCTIYRQEGPQADKQGTREARSFPGIFCLFLDDGSIITADEKAMKRISPGLEVLWELPGIFHHQVNLTPDKKRILTLSAEVSERNGKRYKDDLLLILDLDGRVLHSKKIRDHFMKTGHRSLNWNRTPILQRINADLETSHLNSIYEIPDNPYSASVKWMEKGNIIINGYFHGITILSPDLSEVLHKMDYPHSISNGIHDVQVSPDGSLLVFNNWSGNQNVRYSTVDKYDPVKGKLIWQFSSAPKEMFYSPACGGVQEVGDLVFFSHITTGGYLWSPEDNKLIRYIPGSRADPRGTEPTQQLKLIDVESFLKHQN